MAWIILVLAGLFEIGWAVGLKYTEGFTRLWPSLWTVGAMVLTHRERLVAKRGQRERAVERMRAYAEAGVHPGPLPTPGVFARHNSVDVPALLPDGSVAETSVSPTLRSR